MTDTPYRHCHDLSERQAALRELIAETHTDLLFYAPRLDGRLLESAQIHQALQQFLLRSPRHRLRILVTQAPALVRDCPRLLALCRRLPSRALLRVPAPDAEPLDEALFLADRPYALHRPPSERSMHRYHAADPQGIAPLRQRVEELWEHGRAAAEFRELLI
jgi:hypothetical protein